MYLCYRGVIYCRAISFLNILNQVNSRKREQDATRYPKVLDDRISISFKPILYQYRGVTYLKSIIRN